MCSVPGPALRSRVPCTPGCHQPSPDTSHSLQAVEELLESLDLEKSSYHMGLSRVQRLTLAAGASSGAGRGGRHGLARRSGAAQGRHCLLPPTAFLVLGE